MNLAIIRKGLQYQEVTLQPFPGGVLEVLAVKIHEKNKKFINVLNIYNPNSNLSVNEIKHYILQLGDRYIITGDFNAHSIILDDKVTNSNVTGKTIENIVLNEDVSLCNPINMYTHLSLPNYTRSCLDLTLCSNNLAEKIELNTLREVGSDHLPVKIIIKINPISIKSFSKKNGKLMMKILNYTVITLKKVKLLSLIL